MGSDTELTTRCANVNRRSRESKLFACHYDGCFNVYNRQWKLDRHICFHTKQRPFKCDYPGCSKDYTSNTHLQRHIVVSHKKKDAPIILLDCPYPGCLAHFQNKYSLKKHCKTIHIENKDKYKCLECDLGFRKKRQLVRHSREHRGPQELRCSQCNKSFDIPSKLLSHLKYHREYVCEYLECGEVFTVWSLLRKHYKLKHVRKLICDFCGRSFMNKNTLTKHILTHLDKSEQQVYPCPYSDCARYYRYPSNLRHHIRTTHEGIVYKCTEENCTKVFKSKQRLSVHVTKHREGTLNLPRPPSTKARNPRKDIGVKKKRSMAAKLSGILLPPKVANELALNALTSDAEETIKCTIDILKEAMEEDDSPASDAVEQPEDDGQEHVTRLSENAA